MTLSGSRVSFGQFETIRFLLAQMSRLDRESDLSDGRWAKSHLKASMIEALVRCCVFGFLGPLAGLLALIVLSRASIDFTSDSFVIVLLFTYLFGLLPALITAAFD